MNLKRILSLKNFSLSISDMTMEGKQIINVFNPLSFLLAKKDMMFKEALLNSDILVTDSTFVLFAAKVLNGIKLKKTNNVDIHQYILQQANKHNQKVFYLGSNPNTIHYIKKRVEQEFPNIKVAGFATILKSEFLTQDLFSVINAFKPNILFMALETPLQEKWVYLNQNKINANAVVSMDNVVDFYEDFLFLPYPFWVKIGLGWFPKLVQKPKLFCKQNFVYKSLFLWEIMKEKSKFISKTETIEGSR